jgi:hypothetical protein
MSMDAFWKRSDVASPLPLSTGGDSRTARSVAYFSLVCPCSIARSSGCMFRCSMRVAGSGGITRAAMTVFGRGRASHIPVVGSDASRQDDGRGRRSRRIGRVVVVMLVVGG